MASLALSLALAALSLGAAGGARIAEDSPLVEHRFVGESLLVHARYPGIDKGNWGHERDGFGTNWEQSPMPSSPFDPNSTYARMVIEAPRADTYEASISHATNAYQVAIFTNSLENRQDISLPDNFWNLGDTAVSLDLQEGKNVVIIQVNNWGRMESLNLPEELNVVVPESVPGSYGTYDIVWQSAYPETNDETLFDPEAEVSYAGLKFDGSDDFEGAAVLFMTPQEGTRSLDIDLTPMHSDSSLTGTPTLGIQVGTGLASYVFDLGELPLGERSTFHISSTVLDSLGFAPGTENYIRLSGETSGFELQIHEVRESTEADVEEPAGLRAIEGEELKSSVEVHGRSLEKEGAIPLDWSLSGLSFVHEGAGDVKLKLNIQSNTQATRFAVLYDGEFDHYTTALPETTIASDLPEGKRTITIRKTSEANGNLMEATGLLVDEEAAVSRPAEDPEQLRFEFIGDSITAANQVAQNLEDAYQGYARRLADAYGAEPEVIAVSGRGLMQGYNSETGWAASQDAQMKDVWNFQSYFRDSAAVRVNEAPDFVLVNLGSNDLGASIMETMGTTIEDFTTEAVSFAGTLRSAYPDAKILFAYGTYANRDYVEEYRSAIEGIEDANIRFLELPQLMLGDSGHPNELNHDEIAGRISEVASDMLGIEDPYVREWNYQVYEAEDAARKGGSVTQAEDGQYWSGLAYVGSMGFDNNNPDYPTSASEIASDLSNVSYVRFHVEAPESAYYEARLGYATNVDTKIAYRIDNGEWIELDGLNVDDWCGGHGKYESISLDLAKGEHDIYFTSALNAGGWLNYDYLALVQGESLPSGKLTASTGTGYEVTGLPAEALLGDEVTFSVALDDLYSQSDIVVTVNGEPLSPNEDGTYTIPSLEGDAHIEVTGVTLNKWEVRYYANMGDEEAFATCEVEVGGEIPADVGTPVREGYRFLGWDISFDEMPNGNINVYALWEKVDDSEGGSSSIPEDSQGGTSSVPSDSQGGTSSSEPGGAGGEPSEGTNAGAIVGGVVGGIAALALIGGAVWFFCFRKKKA